MDVEYTIVAADHAARHWFGPPGEMRIGSDAHRDMACRMFCDTFHRYNPSVIDWPRLDDGALRRLVSLPIWDIAVQTEGKARMRMLAYAASLADPMWRNAVELNGWEKGRHREVLSNLVAAYGIALAEEPDYAWPRHTEWAYLMTGFSACVDSFLAFGLFEFARRSGFFPPALVETFEPVIQEETRHIILFANWLAWHRATMPRWRRPWFELRVIGAWAFLGWERIGMPLGARKGAPAQDHNLTLKGGKAVGGGAVSLRDLLGLCLAENDRRMAGYDERLRRPGTMPALARFARGLIGPRHRT